MSSQSPSSQSRTLPSSLTSSKLSKTLPLMGQALLTTLCGRQPLAKQCVRLAIVLCAFLLLWFGAGSVGQFATAQAATCNVALLQKIQSRYQAIAQFRAEFEQVDVGLDGALYKGSGIVLYKKPSRMRWEYTSPSPQLLVTDDETIWVHDPLLGTVLRRSLQKMAGDTPLSVWLGGSRLEDDFRCQPLSLAPPSDLLNWIEMVPRKSSATLNRLQVGLTSKQGIRALRLIDSQQNARLIRFKNFRTKVKVPNSAFVFRITPEMEVIEE